MRGPQHNTTRLPKQLLQELGQAGTQNGRGGNKDGRFRGRNGPAGRKERRKAEREQRKQLGRRRVHIRREAEVEPDGGGDVGDESEEEAVRKESGERNGKKAPSSTKESSSPPVKGILKKPTFPTTTNGNTEMKSTAAFPKPSTGVRDKLAEDDAEIEALEKLLGVKGKKKLPKTFADDGLDELLEGLGGSGSDDSDAGNTKKRKREDEEWLGRKRRGVEDDTGLDGESDVEDDDDTESDVDGDLEVDEQDEILEEEEAGGLSDSSFSGFDSDHAPPPLKPVKVRENPYVAPVEPSQAKYVPPSLRSVPASETESLSHLRRQTLGLLNRLSEANLLSILSEIEKLYSSNPRQHVTSTLCSLLLDLICDKTSLNDTFIILHAGFITAIYRVTGPDFGAEILSQMISRFDSLFPTPTTPLTSKAPINLMSTLSALYTFTLTTSHLLFAYIRQFLSTLTDAHTELLLKILLSCGPQLRHSDPTSLKSIVLLLQPAITSAGGESSLPVRTKFMIETITALKNNRMKTGAAASSILSEHVTRMKKTLGSLNSGTRTIRATEPLNLSLDDLRNTEKRGKWWLVGSSWHPSQSTNPPSPSQSSTKPNSHDPDTDTVPSLFQLASLNHMTTPTRHLLFTTLLSSPDYLSAAQTLNSLPLKRNTFRTETPRVLLQCVGGEEVYNPFYSLVARRLCEIDRRMRMNIQFAVWDFVKTLDDGEGGNEEVGMRKGINIAKFVSSLLVSGTLGLDDVMRQVEDLRYLTARGKTATFVEVLLVTVMMECLKSKSGRKGKAGSSGDGEKRLMGVFTLKGKDGDTGVREGLRWFVKKVVRKSDLVSSEKEKGKLERGCAIALKALERAESGADDGDAIGQDEVDSEADGDIDMSEDI
jgi:nucleolar MIF4G domain-containing protein 1